MRVLKTEDCFYVSGGESGDGVHLGGWSGGNSSTGSYEVAGLWREIAKWAIGSLGWDIAKDTADRNIGVAGQNPSPNENDNGGTSYGIGVCNTFGC